MFSVNTNASSPKSAGTVDSVGTDQGGEPEVEEEEEAVQYSEDVQKIERAAAVLKAAGLRYTILRYAGAATRGEALVPFRIVRGMVPLPTVAPAATPAGTRAGTAAARATARDSALVSSDDLFRVRVTLQCGVFVSITFLYVV